DDELEADRFKIVRRIRVRPEAAQDCEQRLRLAQLTQNRRAHARRADEGDRGGSRLRRALDLGDRIEPLVRNRRDADVLLPVRRLRNARQRREERRLPGPGQANDPNVERHRPDGTTGARAVSRARRAHGVGATSPRPPSSRGCPRSPACRSRTRTSAPAPGAARPTTLRSTRASRPAPSSPAPAPRPTTPPRRTARAPPPPPARRAAPRRDAPQRCRGAV